MPETRSLPVGTDLFHGTGAKGFVIPRGPAFFSDTYSVARTFALWRQSKKPRVLQFEVTDEIPKLLLIESTEDFDKLAEEQGMDPVPDTEGRIRMVCNARYDGWIIPNNYPDGADIMVCEPARWIKFLEEFPE